MANDVRLKIGGDTSDLAREFSSLIRKMQSEADKLKISPAAKASSGDTIRERVTNKAFVDSQAKQYASIVKSLKEEHNLLQQIGREREKINRQEHLANIQKATFTQIQRSQGWGIRGGVSPTGGGAMPPLPPSGGGGGGGGGFGRGGVTNLSGLAGALGVPAGAIGGAATAIAGIVAAESARRFFSEADNRARVASASAFQTQGQGGQRLQSFLSGGASEELMFNQQRQEASDIAASTVKGRYSSYGSFGLPSRLLRLGMGEEGFGALEHGNFSQALRATGGNLGIGSLQRNFESTKALEQAGIQSSQFEALKSGPEGAMRTALAGQYLSGSQGNLDFQRQTGLNFGSFRGPGGFLSGINAAGFTGEQGMGMSSAIMGAGGSTRGGVGSAALGLQAQRNLDITNAGGVLGKLSGGLGSAETTNQAFIKLLAEGTRVGLDGSEYRAENRKFIESASEVISQSGVTTAGGVEQILSQFGRFFGGDKTMAGMEAGKGAFDIYRQTSMAQSGPTGTMRAAGMMSDPIIGKLGTFSRASLFNMPIDQLTPENPAIIAMAAEIGNGTTAQQVIDAQNKITGRSANKFAGSDTAIQRLRNVKSKFGRKSALDTMGPFAPGEQDEMARALGQSNIMQGVEHPELAQNQRMASIYSDAVSDQDADRQSKVLEDAKRQQLEKDTTGRPEDATNRIQAEASRLANELFMSIKDSIVPASSAAKTFAADIDALVIAMSRGTTAQKAAALQHFADMHPGATPSNQPSTGSPNNGPGQ